MNYDDSCPPGRVKLTLQRIYIYANSVNFVFVWVPVTRDRAVKVQEPLPNHLVKQQQEFDS